MSIIRLNRNLLEYKFMREQLLQESQESVQTLESLAKIEKIIEKTSGEILKLAMKSSGNKSEINEQLIIINEKIDSLKKLENSEKFDRDVNHNILIEIEKKLVLLSLLDKCL